MPDGRNDTVYVVIGWTDHHLMQVLAVTHDPDRALAVLRGDTRRRVIIARFEEEPDAVEVHYRSTLTV